ncbi:hypothetical protein [Nitrosospira sp. NpAV]|uniref:hypothetical protein n=1 Tax=Nitrosospira sp. NpAV TaxID=58133 RepID=UPI0005A036BE|nr:hypothetical protein [Nitrosospira sp. NpAV]KIO49107.1 hypothetical protein SQ11_07320 [Nitrosospira sp. NpAV]
MKIKLTPGSLALAVAAFGATPLACALTPARIAAGPTTYVWLSGSSSTQNSVFRSVISLCNGLAGNAGANDVHMYMEGTTPEPGKYLGDRGAYACTMSAAAGATLSGKKVVVYHTVEGGSFNTYAPHLSMAGEPNPNGYLPGSIKRVNNLAGQDGAGKCAAGAPNTTNVTLNGVSYAVGRYNNCDVVTKSFTTTLKGDALGLPGQSYPDGGFSDTEYLVNKQNLLITKALSTIGSEVATNIGQAFGAAVSYPLYYQLQKNSITSGDIAASCTAAPFTAASPNLTRACQPDLPAQRYSTVANKDSISGVDGSLFGGAIGSVVTLARRIPTSGTQSVSNMRFLAKPCATGVSGGAMEPAVTADSTTTAIVNQQSGTGGVKIALNNATGAGQFAMGIISMENTPAPTATAERWAFVKLDGVSPNSDTQQRAKAMDGAYTFWYELSAFTAAGAVSPASPAGAALIVATTTMLGNSDLQGIFVTPASSGSGPTSKGARLGNSCQLAIQ